MLCHARPAVLTLDLGVDRLDVGQNGIVTDPTTRLALINRSSLGMLVVAAGADLKMLAQHRYRLDAALPIDESVLYENCVAEYAAAFFHNIELNLGLGQLCQQSGQLHLREHHLTSAGSAQSLFAMRFELVMQGPVRRPKMAAVAAMPCPAPINLTLSSSVYRARFIFPMIPPMNKITYLVMESTFRGARSVGGATPPFELGGIIAPSGRPSVRVSPKTGKMQSEIAWSMY